MCVCVCVCVCMYVCMTAYIRRIMALPFLPEEDIHQMFERLRPEVSTVLLCEFVDYVSTNWINSRTRPSSCWSVFMQSVSTNDDIKGWHNSLSRRVQGKRQLSFYMLINLLHTQARLTALQVRMVSEKKLRQIQQRWYQQIQARLFSLREDFWARHKTTWQLLKVSNRNLSNKESL